MTDLRQNQRVLGRVGARKLSQDELSQIHGSGGPTSTLSRDPNGVRETSHRINPSGPSQRSGSAGRIPFFRAGFLDFCFPPV